VYLFTIVTEKPLWFVIGCVILGAGLTLLLYPWKTLKPSEAERPVFTWIKSGLRFITITLLAFFLLYPLVRSFQREVQKPVIVIAQDNSQSILLNKDSSYYKGDYLKSLDKLREKLEEKFDVKFFSFGKTLNENGEVSFNEKQTNISAVMESVYDRYEGQNLGAVVLASDGIYNKGNNPVYSYKKLKSPVYTIALGDTSLPRDIMVKSVQSNALAYLGNNFPIRAEIAAYGFNGNNLTVSVSHNGKVEAVKTIRSTAARFLTTMDFSFEANSLGMQRYTISINREAGEISYLNNYKDVFIDVIDGRQKILLLANAPHPDITALKEAIESNQNYEVKIRYADAVQAELINSLKENNLVILHQVPSTDYSTKSLFDAMETLKMPRLYILGSQSNISLFSSLNEGLSISSNRGNSNDAVPEFNRNFNLFNLSEDAMKAIGDFTPLQAPFGNYAPAADAHILFYQHIGAASTEMPLILFTNKNDYKTGIICGEGLWRWRMQEYSQRQTKTGTNEVITKIIQYLAAKEDKRRFRITSTQKNFEENENVVFDAELYTPSYELTHDPDVSLKITNEEGKIFDYQFSKSGKGYHLDCGILPAGNYTYTGSVNGSNADSYRGEIVKGQFSVFPLQAEFTETVANHQLLSGISSAYRGKMFYPSQLEELTQEILKNENIKPVSYAHQKLQDLINLKWIFSLLLLLLTTEWFLRKREGSY
jgi:hypothetical protein